MRLFFAGLAIIGLLSSGLSFTQENAGQLEQHLQRMHSLMAQINNETSYTRRQRLVYEHMTLLHEGMRLFEVNSSSLAELPTGQRIELLERRIEIMQMFLMQIMNRQGMEFQFPLHQH